MELFKNTVYIHAIKEASKKHKLRIGDKSICEIYKRFGSFEKFYSSAFEEKDLKLLEKLDLISSKKKIEHYESMNMGIVDYFSDNYPEVLRNLPNPPLLIYYYGDLGLVNQKYINHEEAISIVGTRNASLYGKHMVRALIQSLRSYDISIVSGLARGIDSEAHLNAMENGLSTIAVLGSGLLKAAPCRRDNLFFHIMKNKNNLILSEFEPMQEASSWTFALRNRLIAALSKATVVVEASTKSGSLITADYAKSIGKPVYVLPGEIGKDSFAGSHELLEKGVAQPIFSVENFVEDLKFKSSRPGAKIISRQISKNINNLCQKILNEIKKEPVSFDYLLNSLKINQMSLSINLSILEINGYIKKHAGACFSRIA